MNCQSCGGKLKYIAGLYVCENCGAKQSITSFFEKTEVFICYVENDWQGRRTKDSIMAQELYNKLESVKINTFYQRISVTELTGTDFENACTEAINKAKVIILSGVSKENFKRILEQYKDSFNGKKILPVYSEIDAYDLPKEFSNLQALNYDNIGAGNDLIKRVLFELGRENEIDVMSKADVKRKKKKERILLSVGIVTILVIAIGIYIVFGTPYVLKSKQYSYAEGLEESGEYVEAIGIYSELGDYRDSVDALKSIYNKYDGYYNNQDENYSVHLSIRDNINSEIEVVYYNPDNKQIRMTSETVINGGELNYHFADNQNNQGKCTVKLLNDGINFELKTEEKNSDLFIVDFAYQFNFGDKTDAPLLRKIERESIISWLKNSVTKKDLLAQGYELEFIEQIGNNNCGNLFKIVDTEINVAIFEDGVKPEMVSGILVPAEIILPEKVGTNVEYVLENENLYIPYGTLAYGPEMTKKTGDIIAKDTVVAATSKAICRNMEINGYEDWNKVIEDKIVNGHKY